MDVNLSELSKEIVDEMGFDDVSISSIQQSLEDGGMVCERH